MLKIELDRNEYNYLCQAPFIEDQFRELLFSSQPQGDGLELKVTEEQAEEIRDLCGEQLQIAGFDEKYDLTSEGEILESLIDKLFTDWY